MSLLPASVRTRLTLWYTVALAVPLAAFAVTSYMIFSNTLYDRTDAFLGDALTAFANELAAERRAVPDVEGAIRRAVDEVRFRDLDIVVADASGRVVASSAAHGRPGSRDSSGKVSGLDTSAPSGVAHILRGPEHSYRVLVRPLDVGARPLRLAGVYPLAEVERTLLRIRGLFLFAIPVLIACAAAGGSFLARRSFRPVTAMAGRAGEIGASTLHERLPVAADDELGALARVLNGLLDRLERSFAQQRRFMADASHELRTPTSIVRTEVDVTLSRPHRTEDEYRSSLAVVRDASGRLGRIVDDIFLLARADAGHLVMQPGALYLDDLVRETVRVVHPLAEGHRVRIDLGELVEAPLVGDADLLGRLLLNVLDNAIKHAPEGSAIEVRQSTGAGTWEISVVDSGPGIPAEAAERVFERFFRLDTARSRQESTLTSGAGLGLPIARRIAEMHGGSLTLVSSSPGRTELRLALPLAAGPGAGVGGVAAGPGAGGPAAGPAAGAGTLADPG